MTRMLVLMSLLLLIALGACSAINDLGGYSYGSDANTDTDTDVDTDTDADTDTDTDTGPESLSTTMNVTSGSGAVVSESVRGFISVGGVLPAGSTQSESYQAKLGVGSMVHQ